MLLKVTFRQANVHSPLSKRGGGDFYTSAQMPLEFPSAGWEGCLNSHTQNPLRTHVVNLLLFSTLSPKSIFYNLPVGSHTMRWPLVTGESIRCTVFCPSRTTWTAKFQVNNWLWERDDWVSNWFQMLKTPTQKLSPWVLCACKFLTDREIESPCSQPSRVWQGRKGLHYSFFTLISELSFCQGTTLPPVCLG